jgi:hypothetical protein
MGRSVENFVDSNGRARVGHRDLARAPLCGIPHDGPSALKWNVLRVGFSPTEDRIVVRRSCVSFLPVVAILALAAGCAEIPKREARTAWRPVAYQGVVFVADGAGNWQGTSLALRDTLEETGVPLRVETFPWSHGNGRFIADQVDEEYARSQGQCLARQVAQLRQSAPSQRIYLVAHSAGAQVVLAAAEALPPGSVERIILLAPAVSSAYDVRPALCCARQGLDVFYSRRDIGWLGIGTYIVGTSDRYWEPAAGRIGFAFQACSPQDAALQAKLRQHPWDASVEWTGHRGGHYGCNSPCYLRAYVAPLFLPDSGPSSAAGIR